MGKLFLGLDCSTQALKGLVLNEDFEVVTEVDINFERDLPAFNTTAGVVYGERKAGHAIL